MSNKIVIFSHNRPTYLELLLKNLYEIFENENYSKFFSSIDIFYSNNLSLPYIKKKKISYLEVNYIISPNTTSSQKINQSFMRFYNDEKVQDGFLLYLDDDCLLNKRMFIEFFRNFDQISKKNTIYSIYNSFSHKIFKFNKKINLYEKKTAGMLGILVPMNIIKDYINLTNISKVNPNTCADSIFLEFYFKYYDNLILTNTISIIQHIGFIGENNRLTKKEIEFSSSYIYEFMDNEKYIELLIDLITQKNNEINLNIFSRIINSLKYKFIKIRVFGRRLIFK